MPDPSSGDPLFRQLTEVNNELVDTQRELARINARYAEAIRNLTIKDEVLSATLDAIPDCVIACDLAFRVTYANTAALTLCGSEKSDLAGLALSEAVKIVDSNGAEVNSEEHMREGQTERWVLGPHDGYALRRADGDNLPIAGSLTKVSDASGTPVGAILILRDITRSLKSFNESLGKTQRKAAEAFAAGIAHELNNLLMIVLTNAEAVRSSERTSAVGTRLSENIIHAGGRASDLVRRVMAASAFALEERTQVDLNQLVRHALDGEGRTHAGIDLVLELFDSLPLIEGNENALMEAMRNVIENAVESIETTGRVTVETRIVRADPSESRERQIEVVVRDSGRGMTPEVAARVFEPFFTTKFLGRGLGMSVAQGIIEGHGGTVTLQSDIDSGTTVTMKFPLG